MAGYMAKAYGNIAKKIKGGYSRRCMKKNWGLTAAYRALAQKFYSRIEAVAIQRIDAKEPVLSWLREQFPLGARLVDVACHDGAFLAGAEAHFQTWGIDWSNEAIALAKTRLHKTILLIGDEKRLGEFDEGWFEVVTVFEVLEHRRSSQDLLRQVFRVLTPAGLLVVSVPHGESWAAYHWGKQWWGYADRSHIWLRGLDFWKKRIEKYGFRYERRFSSGMVDHPTEKFRLTGKWRRWHQITQSLALSGVLWPRYFDDVLFMVFSKGEV